MAKARKSETPEASTDPNARIKTSNEDKSKGRKWFTRARELGEKRQFDYAVEYYVNGLEFWPDAVEEACKPLHGCAVARRQTGGKKPGFKDTLRRSMNDKNVKQAFLNSLWLFSRDPDSLNYLEGIVKNANRLRAEDVVKWVGGVYLRALSGSPKPAVKQFQSLTLWMEELGDRAAARGEETFGVEAYQLGVETLNAWSRRFPKDDAAEKLLRGVSTKLTILKGRYQDGDSFRESIVDAEQQKEIHDRDRSIQADDRVVELIARAEADYKQNPNTPGKFKAFVDQLCRRENMEDETRAIGLLLEEYQEADDYRWKQLADDILMKQLGRKLREAIKTEEDAAIKERQVAQLRFELSVFKERITKYPTDPRLKFEYAVRNFRAGRFDDAIPLFQGARSDAKNRVACGMYLGRCFFRKNYHSQAISTLQEAISQYEVNDNELAKTMQYWLGRAQEEARETEPARKTYGILLQLDYNYKDVRARLDGLGD